MASPRLTLTVLAVTLASGSATVAVAAEARRISLADAVAAAERLPEGLAAQAALRSAEAAVRVAGALVEPSLAFETHSITSRGAFSVSLPLPLWRGSRQQAARENVTAATHSTVASLAASRRLLRVTWFALAAAEQRALAASERGERARRNAEAVDAMFEAGRVSRVDAVRARSDLALARVEAASAEDARAIAAARLGLLMGFGADTALATLEPPLMMTPEPDLDAYVERVRVSSPAVLVQEAHTRAAAARLELASRQRWPSLAVSAGAEWHDPTQPGTNKWVGVGLSLPASGKGTADVAAAERDLETALLERERRMAADAAQATWRGARSARLRLAAIEGEALPAAREAADLTRLAYREGRADLFRVLEAERALADVLAERADALESWGTAFADLVQLGGEERP